MSANLLVALDEAREAFLDALAGVDADLVTVPGVVGEWSVRDLVVHVAAWCEHGARALELALEGRGDEFAYSTAETDAMNEGFLADARRTSPAEALRREEEAFTVFRDRVTDVSDEMLSLRLGNGDTVEAVIRYDGPNHYSEHTEHLRAWFGTDDEEDDQEDA